MKKSVFRSFLSVFLGLAVFFGLFLTGCKKKTVPPKPASAEQMQKEKEFLSSSGVMVCELKEVKLDNVELPQNEPYFIRSMKRKNKDTLLQGKILIEGLEFTVLLPMESDREMALYANADQLPMWWGADELQSMHKINGTFYEFSTLGGKTQFAARPYTGQMGLFKVGKGDRQLEKAEFQGSVTSSEGASVAIGETEEVWAKPTREYAIPVGDYRPSIMSIAYDELSISISHNYHRDVAGKTASDRDKIYGFTIRKDQPYVLDFSNQPVVVFNDPPPEKTRFQVGEEIKFASVLVDSKLDIMIRGLRDTAIKIDKEYVNSDGTKHTYQQNKSLDPTVVISRADGEVVAEGVMPFG